MSRTLQQFFDESVGGVLKQNAYAVIPGTVKCQYRIPGTDLKCAVGQVIPDDKYDPAFDEDGGLVLSSLSTRGIQLREAIDVKPFSREEHLLDRLQEIHDFGANRLAKAGGTNKLDSIWKEQVREVGKYYKLDLSVLDG